MKRSLNFAVALLLVGAGLACSRNEANRSAMASPSPSPTVETDRGEKRDVTPSAGDIADNPALYAGQQVTIKSDVSKLMPNGFFTLKDKDLLVLSPSGQPVEDQEVTVHGTVHTYSAPELKNRYAWFKSDESLDREYKDRPVIVADAILTADGRDVVTDKSGAGLPASSGEPQPKRRP